MKLFLSSQAISPSQADELVKLVGKKPSAIKLALIENAADTYAEGFRAWVDQNRGAIQSHDFDVERIDLRQYRGDPEKLHLKLSDKDVVWLGGGNTYYLRWLLRDTGAENIIRDLVKNGTVYGGGSAGAIVAGPTLMHFEPADDPSGSPEVIYEGLDFTDKVVVPHMDNVKFASVIHAINVKLKESGYKTIPLQDAQAFVVNGDEERVV